MVVGNRTSAVRLDGENPSRRRWQENQGQQDSNCTYKKVSDRHTPGGRIASGRSFKDGINCCSEVGTKHKS